MAPESKFVCVSDLVSFRPHLTSLAQSLLNAWRTNQGPENGKTPPPARQSNAKQDALKTQTVQGGATNTIISFSFFFREKTLIIRARGRFLFLSINSFFSIVPYPNYKKYKATDL